jgi:hypothetical protein
MRFSLAVTAAILIPLAVLVFFVWCAKRAPTCRCGQYDCGGGCLGEARKRTVK